jgi:hypothetical protein
VHACQNNERTTRACWSTFSILQYWTKSRLLAGLQSSTTRRGDRYPARQESCLEVLGSSTRFSYAFSNAGIMHNAMLFDALWMLVVTIVIRRYAPFVSCREKRHLRITLIDRFHGSKRDSFAFLQQNQEESCAETTCNHKELASTHRSTFASSMSAFRGWVLIAPSSG